VIGRTVPKCRFAWELSTMIPGFDRNFILLSIAVLRGTRSQTIFRDIPNGGRNRSRR
jgi:hypothetical protein